MYPYFHSQFGEDYYLKDILPSTGVFVDVGAGDPILLSNTYRLECLGWTGICIDADYRQIQELNKLRKTVEHYAIGCFSGTVNLNRVKSSDLSTTLNHLVSVEDTIKVSMIPLESILNKYNIEKIDLLSVDTEGTEIDVLDSMDINRHKPTVIIVEYNTFRRLSNKQSLETYFSSLLYNLIHVTECNLLFQLK